MAVDCAGVAGGSAVLDACGVCAGDNMTCSISLTVSHATVFEKNKAWRQQGSDIDGEASEDWSGLSVALSSDGNTVAIGAPINNGNGDNSGHVRVYTLTGGDWVQQGNDLDGEAADDISGGSVSLSSDGGTVAIGAAGNNGNGDDSGHVRVYQYDSSKTQNVTDQSDPDFGPSKWRRMDDDIDGEAVYNNSGWSVSLSSDGETVAIGAIYNDDNGNLSGHVRVYKWDGDNWIQQGADIDGETAGDESGASVSLSSDASTVVIGAPYNNANGKNDSGQVRVYQAVDQVTTSTITATIPTALSQDVTVNLTTSGTATGSGTDYSLSATSISIPAGQTIGTATITTVLDGESDGSKTIIIDVDTVTGAIEDGTQQKTITIVE